MPAAKPPDIVFLAVEWQPRALIRAQLIEEGFEVVATASWAVMRRHLRPGSKPRLAIVDLKGLADPRVAAPRSAHPDETGPRVGAVSDRNDSASGNHTPRISRHLAAVRHRRRRPRCSAGDVVTFDVFNFAQALSSPNAIVEGEAVTKEKPMRETMNSQSGQAEATAAFLLQSELSGSPVMIPGEFVKRAGAPAGPLVDGTDTKATDHPRVVAVSDRERLVYEREGGGAPSQRSGGRATGFLRKLWSM